MGSEMCIRDSLDATEQAALEAAKAHFDVQRYRRLVLLAEDNYVQHRYAFLQIQSRVNAGVGRGVDLEQAAARVALAQSNLVTEVSNLHDVTARYQRVVGIQPPKELPNITLLRTALPASPGEAMTIAVKQSAAVSASIESLRSARSLAEGRRSVYQPRVEARVRGVAGRNVEGLQDQTRNTGAEIVLNWNLYNGGADQARIRQQANLLNQAGDLRDKTCRDARQTAAIAFNDTRKLIDQLTYLDRNTLAIQKARDAYRQQFDIGQRSLLDLLNAENELYTARRAYANAEYDLALSYARTHAAMNQLGVQLGVSRIDSAANDAAGWEQGEDAPTRCPVIVAEVVATAVFVWIILGVTAPGSTTAGFAPLAIGLALTMLHLVMIPISNSSLNPARSIATAVFGGPDALIQLWVFLVAPIVGGVIAGFTWRPIFART